MSANLVGDQRRLDRRLARYVDTHLAYMLAQGWEFEDAVRAIEDRLHDLAYKTVSEMRERAYYAGHGQVPW